MMNIGLSYVLFWIGLICLAVGLGWLHFRTMKKTPEAMVFNKDDSFLCYILLGLENLPQKTEAVHLPLYDEVSGRWAHIRSKVFARYPEDQVVWLKLKQDAGLSEQELIKQLEAAAGCHPGLVQVEDLSLGEVGS